jgi:hypothetical protein
VGSTTEFTKRKYQHKSRCNNKNGKCYNFYVYQFIREHLGWNNFEMVEIEKYNAIDILDQRKRERYWLEYYSATLNSQTPSRNGKQWYEENQEHVKEYYKENKEENKEKINKKQRQYREQNKEKIKEQQRQYREKQKKLNEETCINSNTI